MAKYERNARTLDIGPLENFLFRTVGVEIMEPVGGRNRRSNQGAILAAEMCGVTPRSWYRWKASGVLLLSKADKVAVHLGVHPVEIWGSEFHKGTT